MIFLYFCQYVYLAQRLQTCSKICEIRDQSQIVGFKISTVCSQSSLYSMSGAPIRHRNICKYFKTTSRPNSLLVSLVLVQIQYTKMIAIKKNDPSKNHRQWVRVKSDKLQQLQQNKITSFHFIFSNNYQVPSRLACNRCIKTPNQVIVILYKGALLT